MKTTRAVSIYSVAVLVLWCAATAQAADKAAGPKNPTPPSVVTVRGIDPLSLPSDHVLITTIAPQRVSIGAATASAPVRSTLVFRVQILTAQGFGEARKAAQVAEEIFDQSVYIDYEIPNFKVRVGDFADRGAADNYRRSAIQLGYPNCWVVPVSIGIAELPPLYDSATVPADSVPKSDSVNSHADDK